MYSICFYFSKFIELSPKTLMKLFLIGAKKLLKGSIPVDKQTQRFIEKHRDERKREKLGKKEKLIVKLPFKKKDPTPKTSVMRKELP